MPKFTSLSTSSVRGKPAVNLTKTLSPTLIQTLDYPDQNTNDFIFYFGDQSTVSNGVYTAVSSYYNDQVFVYDNATWTLQYTLTETLPNYDPGYFGYCMNISSKYLAVGSLFTQASSQELEDNYSGVVHIYDVVTGVELTYFGSPVADLANPELGPQLREFAVSIKILEAESIIIAGSYNNYVIYDLKTDTVVREVFAYSGFYKNNDRFATQTTSGIQYPTVAVNNSLIAIASSEDPEQSSLRGATAMNTGKVYIYDRTTYALLNVIIPDPSLFIVNFGRSITLDNNNKLLVQFTEFSDTKFPASVGSPNILYDALTGQVLADFTEFLPSNNLYSFSPLFKSDNYIVFQTRTVGVSPTVESLYVINPTTYATICTITITGLSASSTGMTMSGNYLFVTISYTHLYVIDLSLTQTGTTYTLNDSSPIVVGRINSGISGFSFDWRFGQSTQLSGDYLITGRQYNRTWTYATNDLTIGPIRPEVVVYSLTTVLANWADNKTVTTSIIKALDNSNQSATPAFSSLMPGMFRVLNNKIIWTKHNGSGLADSMYVYDLDKTYPTNIQPWECGITGTPSVPFPSEWRDGKVYCGSQTPVVNGSSGKMFVINLPTNSIPTVDTTYSSLSDDEIDNPSTAYNDPFYGFGAELAIFDNKIIAGLPHDASLATLNYSQPAGRVEVHDINGNYISTIESPTGDVSLATNFGIEIQTNGAYLAISERISSTSTFKIYIYDKTLTVQSTLTPPEAAVRWGASFALTKKNLLLVSDEGYSSNSGRIYIYNLNDLGGSPVIVENPNIFGLASGDRFKIASSDEGEYNFPDDYFIARAGEADDPATTISTNNKLHIYSMYTRS